MGQIRAGEVLSESFSLAFGKFGAFLATQGVIIAITVLLAFPSVFIATPSRPLFPTNATALADANASANSPATAIASLTTIIGLFVGIAGSAVGVVVADALRRGERPTFNEAWALAKPRYWNLFGTTLVFILVLVGIFLAALVLLIPALIIGALAGPAGIVIAITLAVVAMGAAFAFVIWFALRWSLASTIAVLERNDVTANLRRSTELTNGARGAIFLTLLVVGLVAFTPAAYVGVSTAIHTIQDVQNGVLTPLPVGARVANWLVGGVASFLGGILFAAANVVLYRRLLPPPAPEPPPF